MILFCDTSALLKLYIEGPDSNAVKAHLHEAEAVAVCRIAWAEAHAALSRRARAADWPHYIVMEISQALVERAGDYADTFALRAYDSVQLAAAFETGLISQAPVLFACFDLRLNKAAKLPGMACL